jgi:hypothetical protein
MRARRGALWASAVALLLLLGQGAEGAAPELTSDNFESTLSAKSGVWVLDFYAPWWVTCVRACVRAC